MLMRKNKDKVEIYRNKDVKTGLCVCVCVFKLSSNGILIQFSRSVMSDTLRPHGLQHTGFPILHQLLELTQTHVLWVDDAIQPSHPLWSSSPPSIFPSLRVFSNESVICSRWPKYWSFNFSISPSKEYSGQISFRINWFDLLVGLQTCKSLLQHQSSKGSILQHSAFFIVQLSQPYITTGKTIALTGWTFVGKVMSLLFNMLSRLVIPFLPRNKNLLISWLQSPSAVILEPKKIKSVTVSIVSLFAMSDGIRCHDLSFLNAEF